MQRFLNPLPSLSCNLLRAVMPPSELDKGRLGHALRYGPLSPLLKCDLRAELRLDVRRWDSLIANPPTITLRRRLATGLACPVSCPVRIRRASMPPGQSFARRPCLAISVHSDLTDQRTSVRLEAGIGWDKPNPTLANSFFKSMDNLRITSAHGGLLLSI